MLRRLGLVWMIAALICGCRNQPVEKKANTNAPTEETSREPRTDREKLESEVREGSSLQDPGGAKDMRDESTEQNKQQEQQIQDVDKQ